MHMFPSSILSPSHCRDSALQFSCLLLFTLILHVYLYVTTLYTHTCSLFTLQHPTLDYSSQSRKVLPYGESLPYPPITSTLSPSDI
ncbi:hypothetical protein BDW74DRAFT_135466 [Aspergillus multicolor]|uniref:uncharacterized protein n=1 Tax=Aspergillus multicolor TaxID=41759 RepID=UPI003CCCA007